MCDDTVYWCWPEVEWDAGLTMMDGISGRLGVNDCPGSDLFWLAVRVLADFPATKEGLYFYALRKDMMNQNCDGRRCRTHKGLVLWMWKMYWTSRRRTLLYNCAYDIAWHETRSWVLRISFSLLWLANIGCRLWTMSPRRAKTKWAAREGGFRNW